MTDVAQLAELAQLVAGADPDDLRRLAATLDPADLDILEAAIARRAVAGDSPAVFDPHTDDWRAWLATVAPSYVSAPFAAHHEAFWSWVWAVREGEGAQPMVAIWNRGGAKSTSAELAVVALGARRVRRYAWYISATQDLADDHVANIAAVLESPTIVEADPHLASRSVSKYGHSKGWRRNRLRTAAGFTVDALGLDTAARGVKLEEHRPDLIILDDVDDEHDGPAAVAKKEKTITRKLLPAGAQHAVVMAVQNLLHADSLFAKLARPVGTTDAADWLADRVVVGPVPAMRNLQYEFVDGRATITGGEPTWAGMDVAACQAFIDRWGLTAFLVEAQHEVEDTPGGMFDHLDWAAITVPPADVPPLDHVVVWCDPAVTNKDDSDAHGIQADGVHIESGVIYRLRSFEARTTPTDVLKRAIRWALELGAEAVGVETDQGGDTWDVVYREAVREVEAELTAEHVEHGHPDQRRGCPACGHTARVPYRSNKAGATQESKAHRAAQMLPDYEGGRIKHVEGSHVLLQRSLTRFPKRKPFDLVDAAYWSWDDLRRRYGRGAAVSSAVGTMIPQVPLGNTLR